MTLKESLEELKNKQLEIASDIERQLEHEYVDAITVLKRQAEETSDVIGYLYGVEKEEDELLKIF